MPQEVSKNVEQDQEGVLDEIAIEAIKERVKGLRLEVERFSKNIELSQKAITESKKRYEIAKRIQQIVLDNHGKITPVFRYEAIPEYWELAKQELQFQQEDTQRQFEAQLEQAEVRIKQLTESLQSSQSQLDKDLARLKTAGVTDA